MIIECLIGIAAITPQFLSDYKTCQWYQEAAAITEPYHHAFELYLKEEDYMWAFATTYCESSGRQYAVSSANACLLYTSPSPRDATLSRMPSSA